MQAPAKFSWYAIPKGMGENAKKKNTRVGEMEKKEAWVAGARKGREGRIWARGERASSPLVPSLLFLAPATQV